MVEGISLKSDAFFCQINNIKMFVSNGIAMLLKGFLLPLVGVVRDLLEENVENQVSGTQVTK